MFQDYLNHILSILNTFMDDKYQVFIDSFRPLAIGILTMAFIIGGLTIITNKAEKPKELMFVGLLAALISGVVFSYSAYRGLMIDPILDVSFKLQGFFISGATTTPTQLFSRLDLMFELLFHTLEQLGEHAGWLSSDKWNIALVTLGLRIVYGVLYLTFSVLILFSIFALFVFFIIGGIPLFFAIIPQTRFIFWAWLRAVANYAMIPVFTAIVMSISLYFIDAAISDLAGMNLEENGIYNEATAAAFFVGCLAIFFHLKAPEFSAALTGGQPSGIGGFFTTMVGLGAATLAASKIVGSKAPNALDKTLGAARTAYSKMRGL
jgi:hypothetical protein